MAWRSQSGSHNSFANAIVTGLMALAAIYVFATIAPDILRVLVPAVAIIASAHELYKMHVLGE